MNKKIKFFGSISFIILLLTGCSVNKAKLDESLKKYFESKNVTGSFTMLNNADGEITVYNMELDTMRFAPGATFHIVQSLVALQTGDVADENKSTPWDGVKRANASWNKSMSLTDAFKMDNDGYFQTLSKKIGLDTLKKWVDSIAYGNKRVEGKADSFWLNQSLLISPDEQLGLVKRLYFDQLPFRKSVQQAVKEAMLREDNTAFRLSYKSGFGMANGLPVGWLAGWIEENRHVYFFVTLVKGEGQTQPNIPIDITRDILKQYGFFEGRK